MITYIQKNQIYKPENWPVVVISRGNFPTTLFVERKDGFRFQADLTQLKKDKK